jgi:hypothetical protein
MTDLRCAVAVAIADLELEHEPIWSNDRARKRGKDPIGCSICWPRDGSWPCISRMIADDLTRALDDA